MISSMGAVVVAGGADDDSGCLETDLMTTYSEFDFQESDCKRLSVAFDTGVHDGGATCRHFLCEQ